MTGRHLDTRDYSTFTYANTWCWAIEKKNNIHAVEACLTLVCVLVRTNVSVNGQQVFVLTPNKDDAGIELLTFTHLSMWYSWVIFITGLIWKRSQSEYPGRWNTPLLQPWKGWMRESTHTDLTQGKILGLSFVVHIPPFFSPSNFAERFFFSRSCHVRTKRGRKRAHVCALS